MSEFEKQVRKALIDHGMTLSDLANELGITVSYVYDILKGNRAPEAQIQKIRDILSLGGVDADE